MVKGISRTDRLKIYEPFLYEQNTSYNWGWVSSMFGILLRAITAP